MQTRGRQLPALTLLTYGALLLACVALLGGGGTDRNDRGTVVTFAVAARPS